MSAAMKKVAFHTLGCKLNYSETSTISRDFDKHNYEHVDFDQQADVYVINTCTVTGSADKKCRKIIRQAKKRSPEAYIAVTGCLAELQPEEIAKIPGVNLVLGASEKFRLAEHMDQYKKNGSPVILNNSSVERGFIPSFSIETRTRSFLKVQDGCDYSCSYCTIPKARGKSVNGSIAAIRKLAENIVDQGVQEIVLTGVNIGDFGQSTDETFFDLLIDLEKISNLKRVRISSIEPNLLTDEIIRLVADSSKFMPHFHIPLQSGSNRVLALMKRRYNLDLYRERVKTIRQSLPHACIAADVIVGFPGESETDFLDTMDFIKSLDISYLHVFTFSERPGTDALQMADPVLIEERIRRSKMLHILSDKKKNAFYHGQMGSVQDVLFESENNGMLSGFTENYIKVQVPGPAEFCHQVLPVRLLELKDQIVTGEILS